MQKEFWNDKEDYIEDMDTVDKRPGRAGWG